MGAEATDAQVPVENNWLTVVRGLLAGIAVLGTGVFLVTVLEAPVAPPVRVAPLFVWNTTAATIAFVILRRDNVVGYAFAILTGVLVVVAVGLVGSGAYGPVGPDSSPLGPLSYVALGLGTIAATAVAWRRRGASTRVRATSSSE